MNIDFNNIKDLPAASLADLPIPFFAISDHRNILMAPTMYDLAGNKILLPVFGGPPQTYTLEMMLEYTLRIYDPATRQVYRIIVAPERN